MGRGVIDEPLEIVAALYKDVESTFIWDHLLVVSLHTITVILLCT